eukprot:scaffold58945_cov67-Phaeocystis_antarctica.AAC.3
MLTFSASRSDRHTCLASRNDSAERFGESRALEQLEASGCPHCRSRVTHVSVHGDDAANEFTSDAADDSGDQVIGACSSKAGFGNSGVDVVCASPRAYHIVPRMPIFRLPRQLAEHLRLAATTKAASPFAEGDEQLVTRVAHAAVQTVARQARARRSERPAVERPFGLGAEALDECEQTLARQRRSSQPERTSEPQHGVQRVVAELDEAELRLLILPRRRLLWSRRWLRCHRLRRHRLRSRLLLAGRLLLLRSHRLLGLLLKLCLLLTDRLFLPRRRERLLLLLQLELALVGVSPDEMRALGGHVAGDLVERHRRAHASCAHFGQLEHLANEATG